MKRKKVCDMLAMAVLTCFLLALFGSGWIRDRMDPRDRTIRISSVTVEGEHILSVERIHVSGGRPLTTPVPLDTQEAAALIDDKLCEIRRLHGQANVSDGHDRPVTRPYAIRVRTKG